MDVCFYCADKEKIFFLTGAFLMPHWSLLTVCTCYCSAEFNRWLRFLTRVLPPGKRPSRFCFILFRVQRKSLTNVISSSFFTRSLSLLPTYSYNSISLCFLIHTNCIHNTHQFSQRLKSVELRRMGDSVPDTNSWSKLGSKATIRHQQTSSWWDVVQKQQTPLLCKFPS